MAGPTTRAAVLALLWSGRWSADLTKPLSPASLLQEWGAFRTKHEGTPLRDHPGLRLPPPAQEPMHATA